MIFLNSIELFPFLNKVIDEKMCEKDLCDIEVNISTYGISLYDEKCEFEEGNFYYEQTQAKDFIEKLGGTQTKMLVGIPPKKKYQYQNYGLDNISYRKKAKEILEIGEEYDILCIPAEKLHFKFYRIDDIYITGGINFGNSTWNDCSVLIENKKDKERLQFLFDCSWRGATEIHPVLEEIKNMELRI